MSAGLIALLDDVAAIAKIAAASIDDIAGQDARAGAKAAGVVIDDAAVTPRYVVGFDPSRELPIVRKIAIGSLRNKLIFLLPAALLLSLLAPWAITPLLMIGGAFLCFEGAEKVAEIVLPGHATESSENLSSVADAKAMEDAKVSSAIKTDFVLSAEIMAITLAAVPPGPFVIRAIVLAIVATGITIVVYGGVALIVKADDFGLAMAKRDATTRFGRTRAFVGRAVVLSMPYLLQALGVVGTAAMLWVGGGIVIHALAGYGLPEVEHLIASMAEPAGRAVPAIAETTSWIFAAAGSGIFGLLLGAALMPAANYIATPIWRWLRQPSRKVE